MLSVLLAIALVVGGAALAVRLLESRFAFFPQPGEQTTPAAFSVPYEAATIVADDGERLHAWSLAHQSPRAVVVYFHGNGGNLSVWAPVLVGIHRQGYTVHAVDYRGYGLSTGSPTERGLYRDVSAVVSWAASQTPQNVPVLYWGRSLGGTMAAYAATLRRPHGVIVESGFPDVAAVLKGSTLGLIARLSSYRFPTAEFLVRARTPVLVMHGDADRVVPFAAGRALFDRLPERKRLVVLAGADHNDLSPPDATTYWQEIAAFADSVR
jgi:fermentation-respiration switch protein FrsA (DUF1100 family)